IWHSWHNPDSIGISSVPGLLQSWHTWHKRVFLGFSRIIGARVCNKAVGPLKNGSAHYFPEYSTTKLQGRVNYRPADDFPVAGTVTAFVGWVQPTVGDEGFCCPDRGF